ncbi:PaaI family thioesterase [Oceanobacillus jeddahense]|uniref:PaaI family thioesterase n=1 Tax=Oceanobacillus jeddahense TaxID=1462527 RepID=A0ABY5JT40_9BACI|nr:PaaI family thioesterase [Oceanobacillus jeddahense]UUI02047.1 PaaI family thioesterase [Oceanobacillus jeddahense]
MTEQSKNTMTYNPYWEHIGLREVELKDGHAILELPIIHEVTQSRQNVHGGVIASMVDAAVGAALRSLLEVGNAGVTVEMKLNYLRPANGKKLIAKGEIIKKGGSLAVGNAVIENDAGDEVAAGMVTYMIKSKK